MGGAWESGSPERHVQSGAWLSGQQGYLTFDTGQISPPLIPPLRHRPPAVSDSTLLLASGGMGTKRFFCLLANWDHMRIGASSRKPGYVEAGQTEVMRSRRS